MSLRLNPPPGNDQKLGKARIDSALFPSKISISPLFERVNINEALSRIGAAETASKFSPEGTSLTTLVR